MIVFLPPCAGAYSASGSVISNKKDLARRPANLPGVELCKTLPEVISNLLAVRVRVMEDCPLQGRTLFKLSGEYFGLKESHSHNDTNDQYCPDAFAPC
jgi:hypothetical protein